MKLKKKITLILAVIAAALIVIVCLLVLPGDHNAPVISFSSDEVIYDSEMDEEGLLNGVTAEDESDGDVSDSLKIADIKMSADGKSVTIVYIARDSSNNIAQNSRELSVEEKEKSEPTPTPAPTEYHVATPTVTPTPTPTPDANEVNRQENETAIAGLSAEAPKIYLSQYAVTVQIGSEFDALSYVEDIIDDVDARDDLYLEIQIDGAVDTATAGVYELHYFVIDSSGNYSNEAHMSVTVTE